MRVLEGSNRVRSGMMGVIILVIVIGVGQSFASVPMLFAQPKYYAEFADTGGLLSGDKVRIAGVDVGTVNSLEIDGDRVRIGYSLSGTEIGTQSRAAIRTDTILGRRNIEIEPRGSEALQANGVLPLAQTTTPYQIYDAFRDLSNSASGWDTKTVRDSLNVLSETIDQTYPHLSAALDGVSRFSDTIGKRDEDIKKLLASANRVAGVLGNRSGQINQLLVNAQTLLAAVNERNYAVGQLLERVNSFSTQVKGFIDDNPNLNRVLEQLRVISDILVKRKFDLVDVLSALSKFTASLGEAVASGPYFKVMLVNLAPYWLLQPFVDAAFKKRGINPEEFWRNAGLPAFRFPDPNAVGFENGAPPPGPTPFEGTPENPGPAVPPGSPCSYTPPGNGLPRPGDPLPCADLTQGPYGPVPGGYPPPNVATSAPNVHGPQPSPGVPAAAIPGQLSPNVPGVVAPLPPAPPGARTVPLAPQPQPPDFTPGIAPLPPALPAPAVPGPGPMLAPAGQPPLPGNPPFLPPGSQG
ncbi:phospholipid/cholesterol/gamma-HCH transport system substrate-binding protein [Mycolicibacterium iranicum]|uniref:Phospholipid/cholesterol/gamma-HCH transport system substrate-binding protein n=1 Tax=Mycolicibacterium iranicum TaxID=912594 RepID=A0A839Q8G3_MYCIR|nr:MCE family protein [Mycolicibacterium iranicum]MBB2988891.1 phospholipid/cholesterol/gamma-HCH transport system substrate-binding protein [Mycolicibacterium iranicum]